VGGARWARRGGIARRSIISTVEIAGDRFFGRN
jgi:hypothetical protein